MALDTGGSLLRASAFLPIFLCDALKALLTAARSVAAIMYCPSLFMLAHGYSCCSLTVDGKWKYSAMEHQRCADGSAGYEVQFDWSAPCCAAATQCSSASLRQSRVFLATASASAGSRALVVT